MWRLDIRVLYVSRVLKLIPASTRGTAVIMSAPVARVLKIILAMCGNVAFGYKGALCIAGIKINTRTNERHRRNYVCPQ